ncbi:hypothetical protein RYX36_014331, partial [Vicia faba]
MELDEILTNFQGSHNSEIHDSSTEDLGDIFVSEDGSLSSEEDAGDNNSKAGGCIFYDKIIINCVSGLEKIDFKEISSEQIMQYHFSVVKLRLCFTI